MSVNQYNVILSDEMHPTIKQLCAEDSGLVSL